MSINFKPPAVDAMPPLPPPPRPDAVRPQFVGQSRDFNRIAIQGALLEFVTFGFYRFWLATRLRRNLWSNTLVEGEPFEYTGTAKELFIGFLFALAILVPIYFVYFLFGVEAERLKAFASTPLFLFLYAFGQFAAYRARRYRLTRTVWRGIRFWMDGSGFGYAWRACLWNFLVYLTLGLALPWREAALERYKMRHTHYGDLQGEFVGTGWEFFKRGWWLYLLAWLPVLAMIGVGIVSFFVIAAAGSHHGMGLNGKTGEAVGKTMAIVGVTVATCVVPLIPFLYAAFKATEWRWWAAGMRFGELRVTSDLRRDALFGNYWATIGWGFLAFTVFFVLMFAVIFGLEMAAKGTLERVFTQGGGRITPAGIALMGGYFAGYFATVLTIGAAMRIFLMRGVWRKVVGSLTITGLAATDAVSARGEAANAIGEGFADSLDIAGF